MLESVGDRQKKEKTEHQETYQISPAQLFHDNDLQGPNIFPMIHNMKTVFQ